MCYLQASESEIIIAGVVSWKHLSTCSRSVLSNLQSEICWEKFPPSLIIRFFLIQKTPWSGSQVLIIKTSFILAHLIRPAWRFYWVSILGIDLLSIIYHMFSLTHEIIHGKSGAIKRLNLWDALTLLPCKFHRHKYFWNSYVYVILFCNFIATN